ncbi:MAG: Apolipoprotein N-acyltransferase [Syntrophorhabdus sp. PtaB.Bin006]|nr:MAG: Apolipoprotein N-acyltransferase [Syntrophorhabdus sp. PtaB.Bin006]
MKGSARPNAQAMPQGTQVCIGLSIMSGILLAVIQPPVSLWFLAYGALIPLLYALEGCSSNHRPFFLGFVTGVVSYLGLIYWVVVAMNTYGGIDIFTSTLILVLFVLYLSLYTGFFAALVSLLETRLSVPVYLSAPILWALLEYLRGVALTGFPWSFLAHSQYTFLSFIQIVSITGTYFISFLIACVNCIIYCMATGKRISRAYAGAVCAVIAICLVYGVDRLKEVDEGNLKTAIVQGNIRQDVKWDEAFKARTVALYCEKTIQAGDDVDLVVWPETAMPFIFDDEPYAREYVKNLSSRVSTNVLFGTIWKDARGRFYNSSYILGRRGEVAGIYNKEHLVPFGEYTPLVAYLPILASLTAQGSGFSSGGVHEPIVTDMGKIGILICYEGVFPYITNETVRRGAQVLVNLTNDAWYERTSAPFQHFAFYIFRAIETDRYVLRSANTGISAIIDPRGRIKEKTPIFEERILKGTFSLRNGLTFYVRHGDFFVLLALISLLVMVSVRCFAILRSRR